MIKFEDFTPGDDKVCFSDGETDWRLDNIGQGYYLLKEYDKDGYMKNCYEAGDQPQSWKRMCYLMPTDKEAFKRKAKSLLKKVSRLG